MTRSNEPEDFWRRVQRGTDDECWPWTGYVERYGHLFIPTPSADALFADYAARAGETQ